MPKKNLFLSVCLVAPACLAATPQNYADMSIEELSNIQVTSVSKKPERLSDAAASVYVITADEIHRSGALTLPDALRLAPNLQVAQPSQGAYAISARGMNGSLNSVPNKLQVLVDGRSVYSPLFSGVFWDAQDVLLADVERIEVISGPGGTLWGVNAVNGVINIITRSARQTQGTLAEVAAGPGEGVLAARYGSGSWRIWAKAYGEGHTETAAGTRVDDARRHQLAGLRADWQDGADSYTVVGNVFNGRAQQPRPGAVSVGTDIVLGDIDTRSASLIGGWTRALAGGGTASVQASLEHFERTIPPTVEQRMDIVDLQAQYAMPRIGAHNAVIGASYRNANDREGNSPTLAFLAPSAQQSWTSLFAQDVINLGAALDLTLGARYEHNAYTGGELLPTARLSWKASDRALAWVSASRTVRAPSRLDVDAFVPGAPPYLLRGGPNVQSEVARVFELGYRGQPMAGLSYSATLFHNRYDHLRTQEIDPSYTFITFDSKMEGRATGLEFWGSAQPMTGWRLSVGGTALREHFNTLPGSNDAASPLTSGNDPAYTAQLRSLHTLAPNLDVEWAVRHVAKLHLKDVPAYTALDARLLWRPARGWELTLAAQNLNGSHAEYGDLATRSEIPRSVAVKLVWFN